ncbi:MAG: ornithine carbamoyltransferase [Acidobacteriota bacterium]|nr:MAG: ornithine carbamoyltransferase [Acidobacteriota bacterium]
MPNLKGRDLVALWDWSGEDVSALLDLADALKRKPGEYQGALAGRTAFLYFEKPSLRTRVTGEAGMIQLGGGAVTQTPEMGRIGVRETVADVARNLERWCDVIGMRTFSQALVEQMAATARIPVINLLTDLLHPCQALADAMTVREAFGELAGRRLAFVGDGNNVAHSLLVVGALTGMSVTVIGPRGFEPNLRVFDRARELAAATGAALAYTDDPAAVEGADAVYTDVWASMGQEKEAEQRRRLFMPYQVNAALFGRASADAIFLHCLPAHRGEEVTDEVADHERSRIFDQAENRLHVIKALYVALINGL